MAYDWRDQTRVDRLTFQMVSPTNVDQVYGELEDVDLSGSSLSADYYSDTRTSGKVRLVGGNWVRNSLIRVVHEVPDWSYRRELGTYIVTKDDADRHHGEWIYNLTLHSRLYGLSTDKHPRLWTIAKNARALKAMEQSLKAAKCPYVKSNAKDYTYKSAKQIDGGTTRLAALFELASVSGNRLDVDGHGRVVIAANVSPKSKTAKWRIDLNDADGIAADGLSRSTDWLQMPSTVVVSHKYSEQVKSGRTTKSVSREITGIATVSSNLHQAHGKRGYTITNFISVSSLSPRTTARAQALAKQNLAKEAPELIEWELETMYLPVWEGDVVELVVHDGLSAYQGVRKCFVQSMDLNLQNMTMKLTLREVGGVNKED